MTSQLSQILLEKYQSNDADAACKIHARYAQRLFNLARARIGNSLASKVDPDDIVQTALLAFFEKADNDEIFWRKEGDMWRLLAAICINHVNREVERYGAAKRDISRENLAVLDNEPSVESKSQLLGELVESVLANESPLVARIIHARLAGFSLPEISAHCGRSERTIRRMLQGVKAKLAMMSELNTGHFDSLAGCPSSEQIKFDAQYDDYSLLRMLGAGTFGKVYLAHNRRDDSLVAVKALRRSWLGNASAEALFLKEARTLASIRHPNIICFLDAGPLPNGSWFIVMELAEGPTLEEATKQHFDASTVMVWLCEICNGLEELHRHGVSHGDLKPANIIVADGRIRIIDFGFSKQPSDTRHRLGGTLEFTAPERETTTAADIYAFGKIVDFVLANSDADYDTAKLEELAANTTDPNPSNRPTAAALVERSGSGC